MLTDKTEEKLLQIMDEFEKDYFDRYPERGLHWGKADVAHDRFSDHSYAAHIAWQKIEDSFLARLNKLDESRLKTSKHYITYCLFKDMLERQRESRVCQEILWHVNPMWGWQNVLTMVAEKQPIGTEHYRQQALTRWATVDKIVADEIHNLQLGLQKGYSAPKPVVERVIKQIKIISQLPLEHSPFIEFAKKDGDHNFKKTVSYLIETQINPALKHYAGFLENEYYPQAREKIGIAELPEGAACYNAKIFKETTLRIAPQAIYEYGLSHMQQLYREVAEIGQKHFGTQDMRAIFEKVKLGEQYLFHSEQDMLDYNLAALERAKMKVNAWFDMVPKADGILKPYPLHRAKTGAPGEYHPPSEDGSRPGIYYINTYEPTKRSRIDQEAILFHELIPGHHFQVSLDQENPEKHRLGKYLGNAGFAEGWALYTERLADEMGLYLDDISRLGMLSNEALRTARLVVDPAIHVMGWSRDQAIEYLTNHTALDENIIGAEIDRYVMLPGQATSYMLGKREIDNLRQEAKERLKEHFDIRQFHNQVLKEGTVTLPMLKEQINQWLSTQENALSD